MKNSPRVLSCSEVEGFFCVFVLAIQETGLSDECSCAGKLLILRMMKDHQSRSRNGTGVVHHIKN